MERLLEKRPRGKNSKGMNWVRVPGDELAEVFNDGGSLGDMLPSVQAVYIWKRTFRCPSGSRSSATAFATWVMKLLETPLAELVEKQITHFARQSIRLVPAPLPEEKRRILLQFAQNERHRKQLIAYLVSLEAFSPPLYVGETANLPVRIGEHLGGATGFGLKIAESSHLSWPELDLFFLELGESRVDEGETDAKARRTFLEIVATALSLSGYVDRRG
jgi:hypothetical protein